MIRIAAPLAAALAASPSMGRERGEIPEKYTWNLDDVFPSEIAWRAGREELKRRIPRVAAHRGHLGDSPDALFQALDELYATRALLERTWVYASMRSDEDTREARPREMKQEAQQLAVDFEAATSWLRPELLALDPEQVRGFLAKEPRLARLPAAARRRAPLEAAHPLGRRGAGGRRGREPRRRARPSTRSSRTPTSPGRR